MAPDQKPPAGTPKSFDDALRAYQEIESFLDLDEETVRLPLKVLTAALPPGALRGPVPPEIADAPISITINDLFFKLSKGKVTVTVSEIIEALPSQLIASGVMTNQTMEVKLPLSAIVAAIDPKVMREKMAAKTHKANLSNLPDPFSSLKGALDNFSRQGATTQSAPVPPSAIPPKATPPTAAAVPPSAVPPRPVAPIPPAVPVSPPPTPVATTPPPAPPPTPAVAVEPPSAPPTPPAAPAVAQPPPPPPTPPVVTAIVPPIPYTPPAPVPAEPPVVPAMTAPAPAPAAPTEPALSQEPDREATRITEPVTTAEPARAPRPPTPARERVQLPVEDELDYLEPESLGGVNVNAANVEQLLTLSGVTPLLAKAIVDHREKNGPFRSIFDLCNVPRLGRATFRKITGMPFSETHTHRRRKLAMLLGIPASKVGDLPEVAAAIVRVPGLAGCVISDRDGMLLAEGGASGFAVAMSAVVPKMFRQMYECMTVVDVGTVDSVSFCIRERMFTIISNENLSLTVVHETNKLTKAQVVMVQKIAAELAWMLSHRAYVGKTV